MVVIWNELVTITSNTFVSLSAGDPLSVARMENVFVPTEFAVHENAPFVAPIVAPGGSPAASRLNAIACAGRSGSVALTEKMSSDPSLTVLLPVVTNVGRLFVLSTVTVNVLVSLKDGLPLSITVTT